MVKREYKIKEKRILTFSANATKRFAFGLARIILRDGNQEEKALVLGLIGELGSGKTTFVQGLAAGFGIKHKILSPTFVILKKFHIPKGTGSKFKKPGKKFENFYHIDCYRLHGPEEFFGLGWEKIISNPQNIVVVEWADKIKKILPENTAIIRFEVFGSRGRRIFLK